jgi:hypothetical protein
LLYLLVLFGENELELLNDSKINVPIELGGNFAAGYSHRAKRARLISPEIGRW